VLLVHLEPGAEKRRRDRGRDETPLQYRAPVSGQVVIQLFISRRWGGDIMFNPPPFFIRYNLPLQTIDSARIFSNNFFFKSILLKSQNFYISVKFFNLNY